MTIAMVIVGMLATGYLLSIGLWIAAGVQGLWRAWPWYLGAAALLTPPTAALFFLGAFAGGFDTKEECEQAGQTFDWEFALAHERALPPFSSPCNADYDLVPTWLNGWVFALLAATAALLAISVALAVHRYVVRPLRHHRARTAA